MLNDFFSSKVKENFPFSLTSQQNVVLEELSLFIFNNNADSIYLLKGYAGTGKSSLIGALVKTLNELEQKVILLAPTGRSAKVFASYSGQNAYTIHKKIYRQKAFSNEPTGFVPSDNLHKNTLFIVDEASMISNDGIDSFVFGSGRLLDDLIQYVYSGEGCKLILMGDTAQLPPVSQSDSPALDADTLKSYGLEVFQQTLTQVVRQNNISGVLLNATQLRMILLENKVRNFPQLIYKDQPDVIVAKGNELIDLINEAYDRDGMEETIIISRSNKQANVYNNGIRNRILYREEELSGGDLLMVSKNNYYWGKDEKAIDFIANGDLFEIKRIKKIQELYGFRFCDLTAFFPDYNLEIDLKIIIDTLSIDSPSLPKDMNDKLFYSILEDYEDIPGKREKMKKIKENPFYNAVQVKFAYAVTCHKAQGGQWKNVFLDISYIPEEYLGIDFYRWLYTAFTRATERIFLINPPEKILA